MVTKSVKKGVFSSEMTFSCSEKSSSSTEIVSFLYINGAKCLQEILFIAK